MNFVKISKEIHLFEELLNEKIKINIKCDVNEILNIFSKNIIDLIVTSPLYNVGIEYSG